MAIRASGGPPGVADTVNAGPWRAGQGKRNGRARSLRPRGGVGLVQAEAGTMPSRIAISGHPLHPYLALFPVGLFAWAFISMIIFAANGTGFWYDIAFWTS